MAECSNIKAMPGFVLCMLLYALYPVSAAAQYRLDEQVSFVYIKGTSTLHDWTVTVGQMKGSLKAKVENNHVNKIDSARIVIPVTSLTGGKQAMDQGIHKALKAGQYSEISYQLKDHVIHNGTITVKGKLTIAGVTRKAETTVTQEKVGKHIKIKGDTKFKMTDFNVKPPEFLRGAFKTGDEISIQFYFMFCEESNAFIIE